MARTVELVYLTLAFLSMQVCYPVLALSFWVAGHLLRNVNW